MPELKKEKQAKKQPKKSRDEKAREELKAKHGKTEPLPELPVKMLLHKVEGEKIVSTEEYREVNAPFMFATYCHTGVLKLVDRGTEGKEDLKFEGNFEFIDLFERCMQGFDMKKKIFTDIQTGAIKKD